MRREQQLPITWHGPLDGSRKRDVIAGSDIFVFPTHYPAEGHPWVIVEAMAAGLSIISTDQAAILESVVDGCNGFIVPKLDPTAVANKIVHLVRDSNLRDVIGREARRLYSSKCTDTEMVARLADAFRSVLQRRDNGRYR